ncbi:U3 small nucleolar RNA-associated protein [Cantharellus anzutake]|uniref:U3 small nucleolar RNA-associated protein n=1 Tax=Cantharellus anzutake TaxID=1750568 RepID=UPI001905CD37|nr:U3 small nucleolar RNA-associated protein [Cantharellus anzutake]KAF8326651.1 U3 small nucleolar RNA-associated protein [Cantharellus anzutake]
MVIKTSFKKTRVIEPLHTSGPVAVTSDGTRLFTCIDTEVRMTGVVNGRGICRFEGDSSSITSMTLAPSLTHIVIFYSSLFFRTFEIPQLPETQIPDEPEIQLIEPTRIVPKCHDAPVHVCRIDPSSTLLASGAADGVVKVWDLQRGYLTHLFRGHGGIVSALAFNHPRETSKSPEALNDETLQLITGSVDNRIRLFDLTAPTSQKAHASATAVLDGHMSVPRGLDVSPDGRWLVSGGRDSVVLIWDLYSESNDKHVSETSKDKALRGSANNGQATLVTTIPVFERIEAVGFILPETPVPSSPFHLGKMKFFTGGEKGCIRVWNAREGGVIATYGQELSAGSNSESKSDESREIVDVLYTPQTATLTSVHADQNILTFSIESGALTRRHVGFNDEIIDCRLLRLSESTNSETHVALATNSSLIKVYNRDTLDVRLLPSLDSTSAGHSDVVLCLDSIPSAPVLVSGSKDRTARVWTTKTSASSEGGSNMDAGWVCVGLAEGHTESVGAIALARRLHGVTTLPVINRIPFMFTGSQDRTLKMWDLSVLPKSDSESGPVHLKSLWTNKAHDKDINALDISYNDRFLATASQDKIVSIYEITHHPGSSARKEGARGSARVVGVCKGHKRGVWDVKFPRTSDKMLVTASGDKTIKLWNLGDFTCLKTLEGHTNTVLRVNFISDNLQLISSSSDGLVKIWNVRDEECVTSLDNHEGKVWALTISQDESTIVSGAADSVVTFWEDCTEEVELQKAEEREQVAIKEQDYMNFLALKDYRSAILLALSMNQPGRLFNLFKTLSGRTSLGTVSPEDENSITGSAAVDTIIQTLPPIELARLLILVRDWNANAKSSVVAQTVLYAVLKLKSSEDIAKAFNVLSESRITDVDSLATKNTPKVTLKGIIDGLVPYTERHFARTDQLVQDSYVIDFILGEMDIGLLVDDTLQLDVAA